MHDLSLNQIIVFRFFNYNFQIQIFRIKSTFVVVLISVILKDVSHSVMSELLQFMYQGVVNVKHAELSSFMKIAQALHIKGLAASANNHSHPNRTAGSPTHDSGTGSTPNTTTKAASSAADNFAALYNSAGTSISKRSADYLNGPASDISAGLPKKLSKRTSEIADHDISGESMEHLSSDEVFLPGIPQISMAEANRFDLINVKRESNDGSRNHLPIPFNSEYNGAYSKSTVEYPNELHMSNDLNKPIGCGSGNSSGGGSAGPHIDLGA